MNENYVLLIDEDEFEKFYKHCVPELGPDEVFFISLSARNKYLTEQERRDLELGRTEMFARRLIRQRDFSRFTRTLHQLEVAEGGYLTKNNSNIPSKAIVVYFNINPSSTLKALQEFNSKVAEYQMELAQKALKKADPSDTLARMNKLDVLLMNCYQRNQVKSYWMDIDFDIPKDRYDIVEILLNDLKEKGVGYVVIDTKGGYHVLLNKKDLNYNFNESIKKCNEEANKSWPEGDWGENVNNKNMMVPLCGCLQGGYLVTMKEAWKPE
jgi:hypothetical protein